MSKYIKSVFLVVLLSLVGLFTLSLKAVRCRFIVKYKLSAEQKDRLFFEVGLKKGKEAEQIREMQMEKFSVERLEMLSKAANSAKPGSEIEALDWFSLATGAHVILLSEDLDKTETQRFIDNVSQFKNIQYIEEDGIAQTCS